MESPHGSKRASEKMQFVPWCLPSFLILAAFGIFLSCLFERVFWFWAKRYMHRITQIGSIYVVILHMLQDILCLVKACHREVIST